MELPKRKNHRLNEFDYGSAASYYITICTYDKRCLLSKIDFNNNAAVKPTPLGEAVIECLYKIPELNDNVQIDKFVLMPNHIHTIINIENEGFTAPEKKQYNFQITETKDRRSVQGIIHDFKSVTTRIYKKMYTTNESLWQASFYDEVIVKQEHYDNVSEYISLNPMMWKTDNLYSPDAP